MGLVLLPVLNAALDQVEREHALLVQARLLLLPYVEDVEGGECLPQVLCSRALMEVAPQPVHLPVGAARLLRVEDRVGRGGLLKAVDVLRAGTCLVWMVLERELLVPLLNVCHGSSAMVHRSMCRYQCFAVHTLCKRCAQMHRSMCRRITAADHTWPRACAPVCVHPNSRPSAA